VARGDAVVSSGDETHLSHCGGDDDNVDSVRIELCAARVKARDIVHEWALRSLSMAVGGRFLDFLVECLSARLR
jgi:hypothetical protein